MYDPGGAGSRDVAQVASGLRPSGYGKGRLGLAVPWHHRDPNIDESMGRYGQITPSKSEARLASEELYNITQKVLQDAGIKPGESLDLFRNGDLFEQPHALTPTHVDRDLADSWGRYEPQHYKVPRESVRALPGLLHAGDDITTGEALVPSRTLQHSRVLYDDSPKLKLRDSSIILPTARTRTPSWYKKQVLK